MKKRKVLCLILAGMTALSMTACGGNTGDTNNNNASADAEEEISYEDISAEVYDAQLSNFYEAYESAMEADSVSERFALMAQAEAYLLEDAVTVPLTTLGGTYGMSRVAPNTISSTMWGFDSWRYHQALVTTELIKTEDRDEMKAKWNELKGSGTYEEWAKSYLADKGYTLKDSYNYPYPSDPVTWDTLASSLAVDGEAICNTYEGLLEYDIENVQQPALAESYEVSEDGLTYTFHIRQGVKWVDSQGREVADVQADDFVAGMQHMMDAMGGLEYLVEGVIENASAYISGDITDFSEVGVEAVDEYTLVYTLEAPCSYFTTMLNYSVFAPMSRSYYESQGGKFGAEYDSSAADYTYGSDPDHIAYCGPYLVTNATAKNKIVYSANESYWNKDNINIKTINWIYEDGSDATKLYNDLKSGVVDTGRLSTAAMEVAKGEGIFDTYAFVSNTDATTYQSFYNLNRGSFANVNDDTTVVSSQTEEDAARTNAAMSNVHFRRAISFAFDRGAYNAQDVGEDIKYYSLRNTITPGNFVFLEEDVTIDINGTDTTFPSGTYYGEIIQAQLDADGVAIKAWDPEAEEGIGSSDGYDGWYNPENAVAELETAIAELGEEGVTVDEENPICLDLPYASSVESYSNRANAYKQSVESALGGKVIINLVNATDLDQWYYAGYYPAYGYEMNYDIYDCSGWTPDYGDPNTYLSCFLPEYSGYMTKCFGIY